MTKSEQSSRMETEAVRDLGSFINSHTTSDADIQDHRSQETVYIGLHVPRSRRHRKRHHRHHRKDDIKEPFKTPTPPSQRVQFLLGEGDEADEEHRPHDIFCEMAELHDVNGEMEWKESARWIKFEEDVEEGGDRWSKPHVATLSLHSIFELRCALMNGICMLDMDSANMQQVADLALDNMVANKQLAEENRDKVRETLLSRHRHQHEKRHRKTEEGTSKLHLPIIRSLADIGKKYSEPKNLSDDKSGTKGSQNMGMSRNNTSGGMSSISPTCSSLQPSPSFTNADLPEVPSSHKINIHFMKKIPQGAESANILVGEVDYLNHQVTGFIRLNKALILGDLTEVPVPTKFIFFLLGPLGNSNRYHEIGRSIATLMSDEVFHDVAYRARNRDDLLAGIDEFLDQVTILPPGEWDPSIRIEPPKSVPSQEGRKTPGSGSHLPNGKAILDEEEDEHNDETLVRTGRLFGGLITDIKRKAPFYLSDISDALHIQSFASFVFLYFACLTPIITFGGLLGDATGQNMAAFESILAGAICGIVYSLLAGQPLTILGSTGPVLVFETILYNFCSEQGLDYLAFRLWIGLWTGLILITMVAFDLSALVRYITRFTEESFAALISLIFIVESLVKVFHILDDYPVKTGNSPVLSNNCTCLEPNITAVTAQPNATSINWNFVDKSNCTDLGGTLIGDSCSVNPYVPDVFFLSVILFCGTFVIATALKGSRNARFFPSVVRAMISDFAVIIAIVSMVSLDILLGVKTPKLLVPTEFKPTLPTRSWVVNPFRNPWWTILAALIPALLCTILIFMDQQITAVIVNRKENKLKKGHGYHLDLFIVASLIMICSLLGLPWFVAATVLSITHVMSLKKESQCTAPGERPKFLGVREQRVTGTMVFFMIGVSVMLTSVLLTIPMPVLYGVFLYMGVSSLKGMQLVCRVMILFMPAKYQPDYMYLRHVRTTRVHLFTLIQLVCLGILWVIKTIKKISIAFPLMVLAMCFVRKAMDYIFTQRELKWLDDIMPEAHKRAKEDAEKQMQEEEMKLMEGVDPSLGGNVMGLPLDGMTISTELDSVNITEEMTKTAIWKTIVATDQSSIPQDPEKAHKSDRTENGKKKAKKHSKKTSPTKASSDDSGLPPIPGSPGTEESGNTSDAVKSPKRRNLPVKFYIDESEEKEHLMTAPDIVVEPPSERGSPEK